MITGYPSVRDCEHGRQRGKCANCDLRECERENTRIMEALKDDGLAKEVAIQCGDPQHDIRWCSTCDIRDTGIDDYRAAVRERIKHV